MYAQDARRGTNIGASARRPQMAKHMWILLACLVSAAGQAATKDTTQWRCRNRKLSCKKWAADNQCTANYPFMAEGVAPHPRAHGTRHTQRSTARDTSQRTDTALDRHMPPHGTRLTSPAPWRHAWSSPWCHAWCRQSVRLRATCARMRGWRRRRRLSSSITSAAASCSLCQPDSRTRRTRLMGAASTAATT